MKTKALATLQIILFAALAAPAGAAPPPVPRGAEIRGSTDTQISHFNPSVAVFPDGSFVVVWTSTSGARARFFDSQGRPTSGERRLPVSGIVDQVVMDRDGSFLVVGSGVSGIYVRRFNRDGTPRGKAIRANAPSTPNAYDAVAAIGPDGRFAVAWKAQVDVSEEEGGYTNAVGRIFTAKGTPVTPEILLLEGEAAGAAGDDTINAYPTSLALTPDGTLAALVQDSESGCLHSYLVRVPPGGSPGLRGLGSPLCSPRLLGSSLAMGKDGSLVATWVQYVIQAQRFAPDGTPRGQSFGVSSDPLNTQTNATVALQAGGSFVVVWADRDGRDGGGSGIFGRAFAPNSTPRTQDFRINVTTTGDQYDPAIAAARQGPVVVVWSQSLTPGGRSDIFARVLSANR